MADSKGMSVQAFSDWMNDGGALWLAVGFGLASLAAPVLVLVHEMGHAAVGLLRTEGLVVVCVGRNPPRWCCRVGRLRLQISPHPARNAPAGIAAVHARFGVGTKVALALAGPIAEASAASVIVLFGVREHLVVLVIVGASGVVDALANLIPIERHGLRSDGGYLIDAIRSAREHRPALRPSPEVEDFTQRLADTRSRWLVLYSDDRNAVRTDERGRLLAGAPQALGYTELAGPALALWWLAFAGWCWREVEHDNPTLPRDAALDALHAARVRGELEPELSIQAAHALASDPTMLGLASHGSGPDERDRFLAGAYWAMPPELRPATVPEAQQRSAFLYGVALRDIERIRE